MDRTHYRFCIFLRLRVLVVSSWSQVCPEVLGTQPKIDIYDRSYLSDCYPRHVASILAGNDFFRSMVGAAFPLFSTGTQYLASFALTEADTAI